MSDRELVELAAKACGDTNIKPGRPDFTRWIGRNEDIGCDVVTLWNPILDDGDALRLAVRLGFINPGRWPDPSWLVAEGMDWNAATRRAIVRAAAEIGRQMQKGSAA